MLLRLKEVKEEDRCRKVQVGFLSDRSISILDFRNLNEDCDNFYYSSCNGRGLGYGKYLNTLDELRKEMIGISEISNEEVEDVIRLLEGESIIDIYPDIPETLEKLQEVINRSEEVGINKEFSETLLRDYKNRYGL